MSIPIQVKPSTTTANFRGAKAGNVIPARANIMYVKWASTYHMSKQNLEQIKKSPPSLISDASRTFIK